MGNAAVGIRGARAEDMTYDGVALALRSGVFDLHGDIEDLTIVLTEAIFKDKLDVLELLVTRGIAEIAPVHLAARLGKLEACEIFCSAFLFTPATFVYRGSTPLHLCAANRSIESALCASFLAQHAGGNAVLKLKDDSGDNALHVAAASNNARFVQAIQTCVSTTELQKLLASKNDMGLTPSGVAKMDERANADFLEVIASLRAKQSEIYHQEVDQRRIMAVWEQFFANAARRMAGEDFLLGMDDVEREEKPVIKTKQAESLQRDDLSREWPKVLSWWQNVLCYENYACEDVWYVINLSTGTSVWLSDHLKTFERNGLLLPPNQTQKEKPRGLLSAAKNAWSRYFDHVSNRMYFLHVHSWQCEQTLPLATNRANRDLCSSQLGLVLSSPSHFFPDVECDNICSQSWVQVSMTTNPSSGANNRYFYNRVTGHRVWVPPPGCNPYAPWALCCEDDDFEALFWSNEETGESIWVEEA